MVWIARLYARRIVNINVNIILAGVLAMSLTLIPVHFSRRFTDHKPTIMAVTFVSDIVFDVVIYYLLHWVANHMPKRRRQPGVALADLSFLKDASLVQFERAILAPVYYGAAMGLQWLLLLNHPERREFATAVALMGGIVITRTLHTFWMIRQERRREQAALVRARAGTATPVDAAGPAAAEMAPVPTPEDAAAAKVG